MPDSVFYFLVDPIEVGGVFGRFVVGEVQPNGQDARHRLIDVLRPISNYTDKASYCLEVHLEATVEY